MRNSEIKKKKKHLHVIFIDLEKKIYSRELLRLALEEKTISKSYTDKMHHDNELSMLDPLGVNELFFFKGSILSSYFLHLYKNEIDNNIDKLGVQAICR